MLHPMPVHLAPPLERELELEDIIPSTADPASSIYIYNVAFS